MILSAVLVSLPTHAGAKTPADLYAQAQNDGLSPITVQKIGSFPCMDGDLREYASFSVSRLGDGLAVSTPDLRPVHPADLGQEALYLSSFRQTLAAAVDTTYFYLAVEFSMSSDDLPSPQYIEPLGAVYAVTASVGLYPRNDGVFASHLSNHYYIAADLSSIVGVTGERIRYSTTGEGENVLSLSTVSSRRKQNGFRDSGGTCWTGEYYLHDAGFRSNEKDDVRHITLEIRIPLEEFSVVASPNVSENGLHIPPDFQSVGTLFLQFSVSDSLNICCGYPAGDRSDVLPYHPVPMTFGVESAAESRAATGSSVSADSGRENTSGSSETPFASIPSTRGSDASLPPADPDEVSPDIPGETEQFLYDLPIPGISEDEKDVVYEEGDEANEDDSASEKSDATVTVLLVIGIVISAAIAFSSMRVAEQMHKAETALEKSKKNSKK